MNPALVFLIISLQWITGFADVSDITQSPNIMLPVKENATLTCSHTKGDTYNRMYWFRQHQGKTMELIVYTTSFGTKEFGKLEETKYSVNHESPAKGVLTVKNLESDDNALYLCAVSEGDANPAYFGNGTKLTVLDPTVDITQPNVRIINETSCKEKVTLVCLAEGFYPDHVSIKWTLGSNEITDDVATDPYATQDETTKKFSMSSRLKVSKKEFTPKSKFTCTVTFIDDKNNSTNVPVGISGPEGGGYEPEEYLKSSQTISLAYGVFIAKSALYGIIILVFVCRKGSPGKRIN